MVVDARGYIEIYTGLPIATYVGANPSGALLLYNNAQHIFLFINKVSLFHFSNKIVSNG